MRTFLHLLWPCVKQSVRITCDVLFHRTLKLISCVGLAAMLPLDLAASDAEVLPVVRNTVGDGAVTFFSGHVQSADHAPGVGDLRLVQSAIGQPFFARGALLIVTNIFAGELLPLPSYITPSAVSDVFPNNNVAATTNISANSNLSDVRGIALTEGIVEVVYQLGAFGFTHRIRYAVESAIAKLSIATNATDLERRFGGDASFFAIVKNVDERVATMLQWYHVGRFSLKTNALVGATNQALVLTNLTLNESGQYFLVASNRGGSVRGAAFGLDVIPPAPKIVVQPQTYIGMLNPVATATYSMSIETVEHDSIGYRWIRVQGNKHETLSADSSFSIKTRDVAADWDYYAVITNAAHSVTSAVASLILVAELPAETNVIGGSAVRFQAEVLGSEPQINWFKGAVPVARGTNAYWIPSARSTDSGKYTVEIEKNGASFKRSFTLNVESVTPVPPEIAIALINGVPEIKISSASQGARITIQSSDLLGSWTNRATFPSTSGPFSTQWRDDSASGHQWRFYRAVSEVEP